MAKVLLYFSMLLKIQQLLVWATTCATSCLLNPFCADLINALNLSCRRQSSGGMNFLCMFHPLLPYAHLCLNLILISPLHASHLVCPSCYCLLSLFLTVLTLPRRSLSISFFSYSVILVKDMYEKKKKRKSSSLVRLRLSIRRWVSFG